MSEIDYKDEIERKGDQVRDAATRLTDRLTRFENWIGGLPGRVKVTVAGPPEIRVDRKGKAWAVEWHSPGGTWEPLTTAPLAVKVASISLLPRLLEEMHKYQGVMIEQLEEAVTGFDEWAAVQGIPTTTVHVKPAKTQVLGGTSEVCPVCGGPPVSYVQNNPGVARCALEHTWALKFNADDSRGNR